MSPNLCFINMFTCYLQYNIKKAEVFQRLLVLVY